MNPTSLGVPIPESSLNNSTLPSSDSLSGIFHIIKPVKVNNRPTIIENFDNDSRINQEEVFGPVVTLNSFENDQDALKLANDSNYGLASIIWTENINRAHKFANEIDSGIVWINCWLERDLRTPFGGVKNSGYGKEGGYHALNFFTKEKNICIKYYD